MKNLLSLVAVIVMLASCGKTDITPEQREPLKLDIDQLVGFIGKKYYTLQSAFANANIVITDSLGHKKATVPVLDKESPNPNFVCELSEDNDIITKIEIKATIGTHGTYKNTFQYFDNLLSAKYPLSKFYAIDADGGVNSSSKTKEDLYNYLQYNTSSGAALEFQTSNADIVNFFFNEASKAFTISIEGKKQ